MALMILFYIVDIIEDRLIDYIVTLPAYWATRIFVGALQTMLFPLACGLFTRRIHDIGFNGWAGIFMGYHYYFHQYLFSRNTVKLFIRFIRVDYRIPILGITWSTRAK